MTKLIDELRRYGRLQPSDHFTYVTINPLADEREVLEWLNWEPEKCIVCSLYWVYKNVMYFVEVACVQDRNLVSYHQSPRKPPKHNFTVSTRSCPLETQTIEEALLFLSEWIAQNMAIMRSTLNDTHIISTEDVSKYLQNSRERFRKAMDNVPNNEPLEEDKLEN